MCLSKCHSSLVHCRLKKKEIPSRQRGRNENCCKTSLDRRQVGCYHVNGCAISGAMHARLTRSRVILSVLLLAIATRTALQVGAATNWVLVGWNNLGMHCMDSDYSVFSILPPYNTVNAQLIRRSMGLRPLMTTDQRAMRHVPCGCRSRRGPPTAPPMGKSNFRQYAGVLYGVTPAPDQGLPVPGPAYAMPGTQQRAPAHGFETDPAIGLWPTGFPSHPTTIPGGPTPTRSCALRPSGRRRCAGAYRRCVARVGRDGLPAVPSLRRGPRPSPPPDG